MLWTSKKEDRVSHNYLAMDHFLHGTYHGLGLLRKRSSKACSGVKGVGDSMHLHFLGWGFSPLVAGNSPSVACWDPLRSFKKHCCVGPTPPRLCYNWSGSWYKHSDCCPPSAGDSNGQPWWRTTAQETTVFWLLESMHSEKTWYCSVLYVHSCPQ